MRRPVRVRHIPPSAGTLLVLLAALAVAVAGCGEPSDADRADALLSRAVSAHGRERVEATEAVLDLAERLADAGDAETAERIYRVLWKASDTPDRRHVRCAAIRGLARLLGPAAVEDLVSAMSGEDRQVAAAAFAASACAGGEDVTRAWAEYLPSAPRDVRPQVIRIMGRRGGPDAEAAVLAALESEDDAVRRAAIEAAAHLATPRAVGPLVHLLDAEEPDARAAAEAALARLSAPGVSAAVAERLPAAAPAVRVRLIRVLAARAARDRADAVAACLPGAPAEVQAAALEALAVLGGAPHVAAVLESLLVAEADAVRRSAEGALAAIGPRAEADRFVSQVVDAAEKAGPDARCALVRVLGEVPTGRGLAAVRQAMRADEAAVGEAAIRVASAWPTAAPAPDLLAVAHEAESAKHRILALRGAVGLAGRMDEEAARVEMLDRALAAAERVEERRLALAALADVPVLEALPIALKWMAQTPLRDEAAAAVVAVAEGIAADHPADARAALEAVLEATEAPRLRERAERLLERLGG